MATIELSRHATDFRKHYTGVRMQQGRVLTDDDFNEAARLDQEDMRKTRVHVIGAAGSPDAGFRVRVTPVVADGVADFTIDAGTLYLGGLRLEMQQAETYLTQRDWLRQAASAAIALPPPGGERYDLVWIEALLQPVSAVEDKELFEVALSGPDTTARVRAMRRVFVAPNVGNVTCGQAWNTLTASWAADGTLNQELELTTDATLTVTFVAGGPPADLCTPAVALGYVGAENQAIRVQLVSPTQFLWGFDNAEPLYRVEIETDEDNERRVVHMLTEPKDQAHWPMFDQWVEFLPWSAVLPNGEKVAERGGGHLARINGSYNPDKERFTIDVAHAVAIGFGDEWQSRPDVDQLGAPFLYMRVWNRGAAVDPLPVTFIPTQAKTLPRTGLAVTIAGTQRRAEDHWIIAARPESPDRVVPWELETARSPHGFRRFRAPLALIRWQNLEDVVTGTVIDDCRDPFLPLTRIQSCCTYTVGDGVTSQGHFTSIQTAIDALPPEGGEVCVLPGLYRESVVIANRRNVKLHGCGPRSRIEAPVPTTGAQAGPVIRIASSAEIRMEKLALVAAPTAPGVLVDAAPPCRRLTFAELDINAGPRSAIEVPAGQWITVADCRVRQNDLPGPWAAIYSGADDVRIARNTIEVAPTVDLRGVTGIQAGRGGVQLAGGSERVRVTDNVIRGGIGNGITLGGVEQTVDGIVVVVVWPVDADDPCSPCKPGDVYVPPGNGGGRPMIRSAGALYDITIEGNRILDMGLNGIGVAAFFDPANLQVITVDGLTIVRNAIVGCLRRPLALIPATMVDYMGYGGIALADCVDLHIAQNVIEDNGPDHLQPVCGVYVLHVAGIELSNNRILNTGAKTVEPATSARPGARAGIHIQHARPPVPVLDAVILRRSRGRRPTGVPAVKIHDNIVMQPLGRALAVEAVGHVSVQDNRLVSRGFVPNSVAALATTVAIVNSGVSNDVSMRHLLALLSGFDAMLGGKATDTLSVSCADAQRKLDDDILPGALFPSGKVLFAGNQCTLDLMADDARAFALSSIAILSLDDVGFHDNQCECDLTTQIVLTHAALIGMTVRACDNRWSEGWDNAVWSAVTLGVLNATTNNQSTHCLLVAAMRNDLAVATGNVAVLEAFCPGLCGRRPGGILGAIAVAPSGGTIHG